MERVNLSTVEEWIKDAPSEDEARSRFDKACQAVANALGWRFNLSPSDGAEIGLIEGAYAKTQSTAVRAESDRACHPFFGNDSAPFRYTGAAALERHINAEGHAAGGQDLERAAGDGPRRHQAVQLPHRPSDCSFTLYRTKDKFITRIAECLGWEQSDNASAMGAATGIYWLKSGPDKGCWPGQGWFPGAEGYISSNSFREGVDLLLAPMNTVSPFKSWFVYL
ncbi:hypothetical protein FRC03_006170 [Tulasnella sp. 419]|nr:hypothetical protein FRC03_006170 [Tulasnella sp. 419]